MPLALKGVIDCFTVRCQYTSTHKCEKWEFAENSPTPSDRIGARLKNSCFPGSSAMCGNFLNPLFNCTTFFKL